MRERTKLKNLRSFYVQVAFYASLFCGFTFAKESGSIAVGVKNLTEKPISTVFLFNDYNRSFDIAVGKMEGILSSHAGGTGFDIADVFIIAVTPSTVIVQYVTPLESLTEVLLLPTEGSEQVIYSILSGNVRCCLDNQVNSLFIKISNSL